ncbi:hypothetical protein DH2020_047195 [Rehmannia glutinosa]|uniref:DDE Tnp4 domain-containing protein n=1 Tax=Rehmannia glutinosa TaxID=99300 RepID=A0ABR0U947_REHGL
MDEEDIHIIVIVEEILMLLKMIFFFTYYYQRRVMLRRRHRRARMLHAPYRILDRLDDQITHMRDLTAISDQTCIRQLRMDRNTFGRLCFLLENISGLERTRHVQISEQVAIFLSVLAHHKKNCVVKFDFKRSGYTISKHFNLVLQALLRLHNILLVNPEPVNDDCTDNKWKWFTGCLGALDGTYIDVRVLFSDKARYRNQKGDIAINVLAVRDRTMKFVFVLTGWEGSAADSRVLRDAVSRPNGLRVLNGNYYLCDRGYTNGAGFLTPYRGVRYHLDEWGHGSSAPQNHRELFNLRHSKARNIIERAFGLLQARCGILRSNSFYPMKIQNRIIMACCLLQNFIRTVMAVDPLEQDVPEYIIDHSNAHADADFVDVVESSQIWTNWRDELATTMFNEWRGWS